MSSRVWTGRLKQLQGDPGDIDCTAGRWDRRDPTGYPCIIILYRRLMTRRATLMMKSQVS